MPNQPLPIQLEYDAQLLAQRYVLVSFMSVLLGLMKDKDDMQIAIRGTVVDVLNRDQVHLSLPPQHQKAFRQSAKKFAMEILDIAYQAPDKPEETQTKQ